jgi:protein-L-isoaspartate(D-aspartate) O-methyltransferase
MKREELLEHLEKQSRVLEVQAIKEAFIAIDRADFVHEDYLPEVYEDYALPIGYAQKMTQPTTLAFMLELLDVKPDSEILNIGSGSGWTTALLAHVTNEGGSVLGVEIIPELVEQSQKNLEKYNFNHARIMQSAKNKIGSPQDDKDTYEPEDDNGSASESGIVQYDRILVNAATEFIPEELIEQLRSDGVMVIPVGESILQIKKLDGHDELDVKEYPGFRFDPYQL